MQWELVDSLVISWKPHKGFLLPPTLALYVKHLLFFVSSSSSSSSSGLARQQAESYVLASLASETRSRLSRSWCALCLQSRVTAKDWTHGSLSGLGLLICFRSCKDLIMYCIWSRRQSVGSLKHSCTRRERQTLSAAGRIEDSTSQRERSWPCVTAEWRAVLLISKISLQALASLSEAWTVPCVISTSGPIRFLLAEITRHCDQITSEVFLSSFIKTIQCWIIPENASALESRRHILHRKEKETVCLLKLKWKFEQSRCESAVKCEACVSSLDSCSLQEVDWCVVKSRKWQQHSGTTQRSCTHSESHQFVVFTHRWNNEKTPSKIFFKWHFPVWKGPAYSTLFSSLSHSLFLYSYNI